MDNSEENLIEATQVNTSDKLVVIDDDNEEIITRKAPKRNVVIDSDEEETENSEKNKDLNDKNEEIVARRPSKRVVIDSDEEEKEDPFSEEHVSPHNKSFSDGETLTENPLYDSDSDDNSRVNTKSALHNTPEKKSQLSNLCDSESEDERDIIQPTIIEDIQPQIYRRKKGKNEETKKMTTKEAAEQRTEIRSESQRMLRESNVSLPYHKPKSYNIKEFLQKRSKLAALPTTVSIKMSKEQLKEVSDKLNQRIKEVEEFYKSESEEEEDVDNPTEDIKNWLSVLVDSAMNIVDEKNQSLVEVLQSELDEPQSMDYEFNLDDINESENFMKSTVSDLLKDKLSIKPKLSGEPDDIIDLDTNVIKLNGIKSLVEKFLQHTAKKAHHKHKVKLDVLGVGSHGEIIKETVSMNVDEEDEPNIVETPGAKLKKLREELQVQMAQKRLELWKQKNEQGDILTVEKKLEEDDVAKDILDDEEEEFEMTETESEDDDDDEETCAFVDNEADEEENEETTDIEENKVDNVEFKSPQKKILRRIIKPFATDSDDEDASSPESSKILKYYTTDDDDILPPNLPRLNETPLRPETDKAKSEFEFLTPVTYLTGLQNLNSTTKTAISPNEIIETQTQEESSQKSLFSDDCEGTQSNLDDLAELCSGKFPETQTEKNTEELPSTQDLLNMCSGEFSLLPEKEKIINQPIEEIKNLDEENDQIISQLLDEAELERFKKKFESPLNTSVRKQIEEVNASGLINSDDENDELEITTKKRKKLVFSDDEDEDEDENEEEIDLHDQDEEEEQLEQEIDSDDEEQQLERRIIQEEKGNMKVSDFFENEAELSESEWGSADEDEKDLDEFEEEQADKETFNEKKMRSELERIHMRQLLDEDNRELKLLQELLLEDGELHGTGRKRQFRWKALDSDNGEFDKKEDDDIFLDEEENEADWRKMRHKREMFLKKKASAADNDPLGDSQILKIGQQIFKNKTFSSQSSSKSEETKSPFSSLSKRGSFLTRNDQVLERLAEYNKVTMAVGTTVKNTKGFVFQTVETAQVGIKVSSKRKAAEGTPNVIKKLRLNNFSPAAGKQTEEKSSRAKKLFGNW